MILRTMMGMMGNDLNDGFWLFGVLGFGLTRLIGHFGALLLFPGFRFQPISRFLVLPGAWAWFSPCRDRLASALPVLSDCRRRLLCSQQSCFGVTSFCFLFRFSRAAPGPHPGPLPSNGRGDVRSLRMGRAFDLWSTYAVSLVTGFEPFPFPASARAASSRARSAAMHPLGVQRVAASHRRPRQSGAWRCSRPPWRSGADVSHHPRGVPGPYPRTL